MAVNVKALVTCLCKCTNGCLVLSTTAQGAYPSKWRLDFDQGDPVTRGADVDKLNSPSGGPTIVGIRLEETLSYPHYRLGRRP